MDTSDIKAEDILALTQLSEIVTYKKERALFKEYGHRSTTISREIDNLRGKKVLHDFVRAGHALNLPIIQKLGITTNEEAQEALETFFDDKIGHGKQIADIEDYYYKAAEYITQQNLSPERLQRLMSALTPENERFISEVFENLENWIEYYKTEPVRQAREQIINATFEQHAALLNKPVDELTPQDEAQIGKIFARLQQEIDEKLGGNIEAVRNPLIEPQ